MNIEKMPVWIRRRFMRLLSRGVNAETAYRQLLNYNRPRHSTDNNNDTPTNILPFPAMRLLRLVPVPSA
jgi:hypothetical protein